MKFLRLTLLVILPILLVVSLAFAVEHNIYTLWTTIDGKAVPLTAATMYAVHSGADTSSATKYWALNAGWGTYYFLNAPPDSFDIYAKRTPVSFVTKEATGVRLGLFRPIDRTVTTDKINFSVMIDTLRIGKMFYVDSISGDPATIHGMMLWFNVLTGKLRFAINDTTIKSFCWED